MLAFNNFLAKLPFDSGILKYQCTFDLTHLFKLVIKRKC